MVIGALALPSESVVVVCALMGASRRLRPATAENLLLNVRIFGDFGDGDTHGSDGS
jgi:hypothetical protein